MKIKRIVLDPGCLRKIKKLEKKGLYSLFLFQETVTLFLQDETNQKFRKHKITTSHQQDIYSISLGYDLRTLYYRIEEKGNNTYDYIFFDIGNHDTVC